MDGEEESDEQELAEDGGNPNSRDDAYGAGHRCVVRLFGHLAAFKLLPPLGRLTHNTHVRTAIEPCQNACFEHNSSFRTERQGMSLPERGY